MNVFLSKVKNTRIAYLIALISGALLPLAFSPFDLMFFAVLSPAVLFLLWLDSEPKRAFIIGYCFAIGYFGAGVSWVSISMYRFGGVAMPLATALTVLFVLVLSFYMGAAGYTIRRFFNTVPKFLQLLLLMPSSWVFFEWVRSWLFTGFPWLSLGYSQTNSPLANIAPIVGIFGVSLIVLLIVGLVCLIIIHDKKSRFAVATLVLVIICSTLDNIKWVSEKGDLITASLLQGNISQNKKWLKEYRQPTINTYKKMTRENWDSDLIVWPETALPVYFHQAKKMLTEFAEEAKTHNTSVVLGLPVLDEVDNQLYYNSMVMLDENLDLYHKRHLVPFGEFLPMRAILGDLIEFMDVPMANFSRGEEGQPLLMAGNIPLSISICYEDAFGEEMIGDLPEAQILVNVSNDAWFGDSFAPHQHLQMARMRAIEMGRPMLRATNTGISAFIDHNGKVQKTSNQFAEQVITNKVQPMQGRTPYVIWGNWLVITLCVVIFIVGLLFQYNYLPRYFPVRKKS